MVHDWGNATEADRNFTQRLLVPIKVSRGYRADTFLHLFRWSFCMDGANKNTINFVTLGCIAISFVGDARFLETATP